ncbi:MAG: hypothetical protein JSS03_09450 [Proteobacteria bacterium]|nr:hypothetical protein [Pseudomonadota bacterium]
MLASGCATTPTPPPPPAPAVAAAAAPEFAIAAVMLDAWNALGQLLVNTPGVTYRSRSQMMGLYDVEYRGQRILLLTRAHVLDAGTHDPSTLVQATGADGKPDASPAALDLLRQLQARMPAELQHLSTLPDKAVTPPRKKGKRR